MGIVLPETYFFSDSYVWLQNWIYAHFHLRAIINIPMEAFPGFCRAKTNLYILEKKGLAESNLSWVKEGKVLVINSKTCGVNKDGNELYVVDSITGERDYTKLDDELTSDCWDVLFGKSSPRVSYVDLQNIIDSKVAIPSYYNQEYYEDIEDFCQRYGFGKASLGELHINGQIEIFHGHGSPSADQRIGDVPYIKVSDLRAGAVNINHTNMIPFALAKKYWKGTTSNLRAYDLISPERASKNIGEFCVLLPGQERVVLTKEIIGLRSDNVLFDQFYLLWAMNLPYVRRQWNRVVFLQTNREDVGSRFLEIEIPIPKDRKIADEVSYAYRTYYKSVAKLKLEFDMSKKKLAEQYR